MAQNHQHLGTQALADTVRDLYAQGQTDYSMEPIVLVDKSNRAIGRIADGDAVIFCCRRGEREIQLTEAFTEKGFDHFSRPDFQNLDFVILTLYHEKFKNLPVAFAPTKIKDTLGEIVSNAGLRQLHISESEKFSHITFFFNGCNNQPFKGEDDICVPTLKGIPFDQIPGLSLPDVVKRVEEGIKKGYDLIVTNFANGDVIGHTSNNNSKIQCAALVDGNMEKLVKSACACDYVVLITADHGNLEEMINPDGTLNVAHTTNPVPFVLIDPRATSSADLREGKLADVAPTVLNALDLPIPHSMKGMNLAPGYDWGGKRRVLLVILDGWGMGKNDATNPIFLADTPAWDNILRGYPHSSLQPAGLAVGLQDGKAGNSEAGHMNIGAGRVVLQDDVRLDLAMQDGSFYNNEIFCKEIDDAKKGGTSLHLIGLLTEKSSHGSINYPLALLKMAKERGLEKVYLHIIFDGRSTQPGSAPALLDKLGGQIEKIGIGQVVTGMGRGIALDRDGNYDKTQLAFEALVHGAGRICFMK